MEDIFKDALAKSKGISIDRADARMVVKKTKPKVLDITVDNPDKKPVKNWADLKEAMDGELAEKFYMIISKLPPAQFLSNYLKALEFFKPKVIRTDGNEGKKRDNKVKVLIKKRDTA